MSLFFFIFFFVQVFYSGFIDAVKTRDYTTTRYWYQKLLITNVIITNRLELPIIFIYKFFVVFLLLFLLLIFKNKLESIVFFINCLNWYCAQRTGWFIYFLCFASLIFKRTQFLSNTKGLLADRKISLYFQIFFFS